MKFTKYISIIISSLSIINPVVAQESAALNDAELGLAGLKEALNNPEMLAQMMADLQDPEILAEAKKMRESPEFQEQMKKFAGTDAFKEGMKKTKEIMDDPNQSAKLQAQMEHMIKRGQDSMKDTAANTMKAAMESFSDPEVMGEATKMFKDPDFQKKLQTMMKDPSFKPYLEAMGEMMKDPAMKSQVESLSDQFKSEL